MSMASEKINSRVTIEIVPPEGMGSVDLKEVWRYRELLATLVWRDLKVRYRQTLLGVAWVVGQPLIMVAMFTLIFQKVAGLTIDSGVPYPLFVLTGLLQWTFFSTGVQNAGLSILGNTQLVSKVYFPRLIVPAAPVAGCLIDFAVIFAVVGLFQAWYGWVPQLSAVVLLPLALMLLLAVTFGTGCWMAALNVDFRDVRVVMPFLLQIGMYATAVVYPPTRLPSSLQPWAAINPMNGVLELFRGGLLGEPIILWHILWTALAAVLLLAFHLY